jgi:dTMP kinase
MSGLFITFEGIEGVGKSTLQRALAEVLQARAVDAFITREPGGTKLGEYLRQAVLSPEHESVEPIAELLVMFAARAQHVMTSIQPALAKGSVVLCDRFSDTSFAYQGGGRGLPSAWIESLVAMTHADLQPDLTFWLDLPVSEALARVAKRSAADRIEQEKVDFFERARACYALRASAEPKRIVRLDASHTPEELVQQALRHIMDKMN